MFLRKKSLTKLGNYKLQQQHKKMIFQQKSWKNNQRCLLDIFIKTYIFCIENSIFPSDLKVADVIPAFKKKSKTSKGNYRPISVSPNIFKIYERCLYNKCRLNLITSYLNINVDFGITTQPSKHDRKMERKCNNGGVFALLWQSSLKLLTVYIMSY